MIQWNRASIDPAPKNQKCLLLLDNGTIVYEKATFNMPVVGWSYVNMPHWLFRKQKGRVSGEKHHNAKLSDYDCKLIRELRKKYGLEYKDIAEKFNSGTSTIYDIVNYNTRK